MKKTQKGPGRPAYVPKLPTKLRWTMLDLQLCNKVNPATGKGPNCSKLTLVNWLADELANRRSGLVLKVTGETKEPNSKSGLGRKAFVYVLRSRKDELTKDSTPAKTPAKKSGLKTAAKSPVSVKLNTTADYEKAKADLLAPTPAPVVAATPEPAPTSADVTPAPAPVAETSVASTAPAEPVAAQ